MAFIRKDLTPLLRGWAAYFRWSEVKGVFEDLDQWIRRRLRCLIWRQWKKPKTRFKQLVKAGLSKERAANSAYNGRGPWWNVGAAHMNDAFKCAYFRRHGLVSLQEEIQRLNLVA